MNKPVHQLFEAFGSNRLENKQKLYDELRDLIQKKKIQGMKSIKEMLDIPTIAEICSGTLLNAIHSVINNNVEENHVINNINKNNKNNKMIEEAGEEDEEEWDDEDDEDDLDDDEDDEDYEEEEEDDDEDPDYVQIDDEMKDTRNDNLCNHNMQRELVLYACNNIRACMDKIVKVSYRMNGVYQIKNTDIQNILANVDMFMDVIDTVLKK